MLGLWKYLKVLEKVICPSCQSDNVEELLSPDEFVLQEACIGRSQSN